ncbi:MAG: protein-L-isoaspartate O-methyltransferase [Candidatus Hermodarchaeota archaeon]
MDRNESFKESLKNKKKRLLDTLVVNQILKDKRLIKAFMEIPLESFIPGKFKDLVKLYEDVPNLFYYDEHNPKNYRTISAPHMITIMLQGLALEANDDLLILGAKSGYIAALAHHLAPKGEIVILEANSEIAKITAENLKKLNLDNNITIIVKNPLKGMPDLCPWQKILVTGAIEQSKIYPLLKQLDKDGGVLFAPIGQELIQMYTQILRENDKFYGKQQLQVKFSPLITQIEIDELELITDLDAFEISDEKMISELKSEAWDTVNKKIEIKYTKDILEKISPEPIIKSKQIGKQERKFVLSQLEDVVENILKLKKEEDIDECFGIVDRVEQILGELKNYKRIFEIKIKKMQQILNQIRSYNIIRKELKTKDLTNSARIEQKLIIINKQIEQINILLSFLTNEKTRIESDY